MVATSVKVPGVGPVKRDYVIVVGLGAVAAVGYTYLRRPKPGSDLPLDPIDPGAGLIENTPQYASTGDPGLYGADTGPGQDYVPGRFILNSQWQQYVVDYLTQNGTERLTADTAVGKYLDHQRLTTTEQNLIRIALGAAGNPPQGTYTILSEIPGGTTPGVQTKPGQVSQAQVFDSERQRTYLTVRWNPPTTGGTPTGYKVQLIEGTGKIRENVTLGPGVKKFTTKTNLAPGHPYRFHIEAINSAGTGPAWSGTARTRS